MIDLARFDAITFDCYGTLIDWEAGILGALRPLAAHAEIAVDDQRLLEAYAEAEVDVEGAYAPYRDVLVAVCERVGAALGFAVGGDDRRALVDSLASWPPFPDTVDALRALAARCRLGVLSNIDRDLFAHSRARLERGFTFTWVVTAEDVGAYKPDLRVFAAAERELGVPRERWLHVAQSQFHDIAPARALGLACVHIDRRAGRPGHGATRPSDARADLTLPDLRSLAALGTF